MKTLEALDDGCNEDEVESEMDGRMDNEMAGSGGSRRPQITVNGYSGAWI